MTTVNIKTNINADIQSVWDAVTSLENYSWRSDLERIEILEYGNSFVECTKDGFATKFNITKVEPLKTYEFTMQNKNINGSWVGKFNEVGNVTSIDFTENISTNNIIMKIFMKKYLKKHQEKYITDLKIFLEK